MLAGTRQGRLDTAGHSVEKGNLMTESADFDHLLRRLSQTIGHAVVEILAERMPHDQDSPRVLITVEEAARRLSVSRTIVWQLVKSGALETVKIGRLRRVPTAAIDDYVAALRNGAR